MYIYIYTYIFALIEDHLPNRQSSSDYARRIIGRATETATAKRTTLLHYSFRFMETSMDSLLHHPADKIQT